jgi:hypothetical protein
MKTLLYCVVLLAVVGVAGFLYRNVLEHQTSPGGGVACTLEAKICPDGTSVGRVGPNCAFAACPADNVELPDIGVSFALPAGYVAGVNTNHDGTVLGIYEKQGSTASSSATITVSRYPIPANQTAQEVVLANTTYAASGNPAQNISEFTPKLISNRTFLSNVIDRSVGQIQSSYFLTRSNDVLRFDITEMGVTNWTDPSLIVDNLPEHQALLRMLATLQVSQN